jgi:hypothetical protein
MPTTRAANKRYFYPPKRDIFSSLPSEVRALIYDHLLPRSPIIKFSRDLKGRKNFIWAHILPWDKFFRSMRDEDLTRKVMELVDFMRVSQLIRQELLPRFYRQRHWRFTRRSDLDWFRLHTSEEVKQLISSVAYTVDINPDARLSRSVGTVLEAFPNLTQLALLRCARRSNRASGPNKLWTHQSLLAFEMIQDRRPALSRTYRINPEYANLYTGSMYNAARFVNEEKPLHPPQAGTLQYLNWASRDLAEVSFDVRQERKYQQDEEKELADQRKQLQAQVVQIRRAQKAKERADRAAARAAKEATRTGQGG